MAYDRLLTRAHDLARAYLHSLPERFVNARVPASSIAERLGGPLPDASEDPLDVLEALAAGVEPGLVATAGPRYFGFVTGGSLPVAVAADWLVSAWDQNVGLHVMSPAIAALEDITAAWILDLLGLPPTASVGFVTGAHMANVTALAAARHEVLRRAGWDVEAGGLQGAPRVAVLAGDQAHASIGAACRMIGLGASTIQRIASDDQGRMLVDDLARTLAACDGPTIVCAQAGNVNTGACDPIDEIAARCRASGAWLHVDGAFGLWAAAAPDRRHLVAGLDAADSWSTDGHKWLNVPYDSGIAIVRHPGAHRAAMGQHAAYLMRGVGEQRDGMEWTPEASRRARVAPLYVALRTMGRRGVGELVSRCCALALRMAARLRPHEGIEILNDVVLNQVLVRVRAGAANITPEVLSTVQQGGVCWVGGTSWQGEPAMRISISGWPTSEGDVDRSAEAILAAARAGAR